MTSAKTLSVFAPAKINLYLHVTGRLDSGYHTLDSLVAFADIGDEIDLSASQDFKFDTIGAFAGGFKAKELDSSPSSSNLVVQAAWALSRAEHKTPDIQARLTKSLPMGAGLGGGSSDAAAMLWGLLEWWGLPKNSEYLLQLMSALGADVPVCFLCETARMRGIGDILDKAPAVPEVPIVLVYPAKPCPTRDVFLRFEGEFKTTMSLPATFSGFDDLVGFLEDTENDLMTAAQSVVPEIGNVLSVIAAQDGCALSRMSGSGSGCYGLFEHEHDAQNAAETLAEENPDWWVKTGWLGRPERY